MKKKGYLPIPAVRAIRKLGSDISDARRRRRVPMALMAERANVSRSTLSKIEAGDPSVSMANYASVIFCLGMIGRLSDLVDASVDLTGLQIETERLPKRIRIPKDQ